MIKPNQIQPNQIQPNRTQPNRSPGQNKTGESAKTEQRTGNSFHKVLETQIKDTIKISGHAQQRLRSRNIALGQSELARLEQGLQKAAEKGSRDSLILMDKLALVVSVENRTVITAVDEASLKQNVFTNIDSAIFV